MTTHYAYMTVYPPEVRPPRNLTAPQILLAGYVLV